jgi:hypothetical protein
MGPRQPLTPTVGAVPRDRPPSSRELIAALLDGAHALRLLARESAFNHNCALKLGARDAAATIETKHYTRLRRHADILTAHADRVAALWDDLLEKDRETELHPNEDH